MNLKKREIGIFAKGILHDFGQRVVFITKRWIADVLDRKETFKIEKKPLKGIKDLFLKNTKLAFSKRLVHRFRQKWEISLTIIFLPKRPRKRIWRRNT